jgi:hypothetical protein
VVSFKSRLFYPRRNRPRYPLDRMYGPQSQSGCCGKVNLGPAGNRTRTVQPLAIPTELSAGLIEILHRVGELFLTFPSVRYVIFHSGSPIIYCNVFAFPVSFMRTFNLQHAKAGEYFIRDDPVSRSLLFRVDISLQAEYNIQQTL